MGSPSPWSARQLKARNGDGAVAKLQKTGWRKHLSDIGDAGKSSDATGKDGEKEHLTRKRLDTTVKPGVGEGGRKTRRSAAAGEEEGDLDDDREQLRLREASEEEEGVTAVPSPRSAQRTAANNDDKNSNLRQVFLVLLTKLKSSLESLGEEGNQDRRRRRREARVWLRKGEGSGGMLNEWRR